MSKYFEGTLEEHNGEQEYTYTYLIEAKDLDEAKTKWKQFCSEWYEDGKEIEENIFEFPYGAPMVINKGVWEVDREEFIQMLVNRYSIS